MRYLIFMTPRTASQFLKHLLFPSLQGAYRYIGMLSEAFSPSRYLVEVNGVLCSASLNVENRKGVALLI
jgi:hypothetical protein